MDVGDIVCHQWKAFHTVRPVHCSYCEDYIWGAKCAAGRYCLRCGQKRHHECRFYENLCAGESGIIEESGESRDFEDWTTDDWFAWLCVIGFSNHVESFRLILTNCESILSLPAEKLPIKYNLEKEALLDAIKELIDRASIDFLMIDNRLFKNK